MEDDNGLELSLGLSVGGSSGKTKVKDDGSSDNNNRKEEGGDRSSKVVDDFKNFLHVNTDVQDSATGSQRSDSVKPQENFFNDLSRTTGDADGSMNRIWSDKHEEETRSEAGNKRKSSFIEVDTRREKDDKRKMSYISITTGDDTAEDEDVADSEVEGSTSKLRLQNDDLAKRFNGVGGHFDANIMDPQGQKRLQSGFMNYIVPIPIQSVNVMNLPYSMQMKDSSSVTVPGSSSRSLPMGGHMIANSRSEQPGNQSFGNAPVMFGYSQVQLPVLDKDSSRGSVSHHPQQFHPTYIGNKHTTLQVAPRNLSDATHYEGRNMESAKSEDKRQTTLVGSINQAEEDVRGSNMNYRASNATDPSTTDSLSFDFSAIKPGIASDVKFGGSGSCPNLPWVSTTGSGPNGRTISGVTYRYNQNQIKVVCACHGTHMSPEEFVRHASEENGNPEVAAAHS